MPSGVASAPHPTRRRGRSCIGRSKSGDGLAHAGDLRDRAGRDGPAQPRADPRAAQAIGGAGLDAGTGEEPGKAGGRPARGQQFQAVWPNHPEWVAMFDGHPQGEPARAGRRLVQEGRGADPMRLEAHAGSASTATTTGGSPASEFPGSDADFAPARPRPRRRRSASATSTSRPMRLTPSPGMMVFYIARPRRQRQDDPRGARGDLPTRPTPAATGFLSLADLQEALTPPSPRPRAPRAARRAPPGSP